MTGFIEEPSREDTILVIVSYLSESKAQYRFPWSEAVKLAKHKHSYAIGKHSGVGFYPCGGRLVSIDHSKVEAIEFISTQTDKLKKAIGK